MFSKLRSLPPKDKKNVDEKNFSKRSVTVVRRLRTDTTLDCGIGDDGKQMMSTKTIMMAVIVLTQSQKALDEGKGEEKTMSVSCLATNFVLRLNLARALQEKVKKVVKGHPALHPESYIFRQTEFCDFRRKSCDQNKMPCGLLRVDERRLPTYP